MERIWRDLTITAMGFATSLATAAVLYLLEDKIGLAFYSLMLWFVLPLGAIGSGFLAASGYYFGARWLGQRPTKLLLANIVIVSGATFIAIHLIGYATLIVDGRHISEYVSFSQYLDFVLEHQSFQLRYIGARVGTTGEIGTWGYITAFLQIAGFAVGGAIAYVYLATLPLCEKCGKYLKRPVAQIRYSDDPKAFAAMVRNVLSRFSDDSLQKALDEHKQFGEPSLRKGAILRSTLERRQCPLCHVNRLRFWAHKLEGGEWRQLDGMEFSKMHIGELRD